MIDHVNGGTTPTITWCAGRQGDVIQITTTDVTVIETTGNFMDAGKGERKTIAQASLTLTSNNLTRTLRTEIHGTKLTKFKL
jgi:predicted secreted protein